MKIIWDLGSGLSADQHLIDLLEEPFPKVDFSFTDVWRRSFRLADGANMPLSFYDVVEQNMPGDLVMFESTLAYYLFNSGYLEPLDDYIASDLSIPEHAGFDWMDHARKIGDGKIYGIPFGKNVYALYYNSDIFKELNIPVPTDGMTWDEVFDLAKTIQQHPLIGERASLRYVDVHLIFSQFHSRILDPETGLPDANSPNWEKVKLFLEKATDVLSNDNIDKVGGSYPNFADGRVAMIAGRFHGDRTTFANPASQGFISPFANWDLASFPVHYDAPGTGPAPAYYYLGIPRNSLRKQDAFRMISYLLEDEPQLANSLRGVASIRKDPAMTERFGELSDQLQGKRVQAFFHHPEEGTMDPAYDADMEHWGELVYDLEFDILSKILDFRRAKLGKLGVEVD